MPAAGRLPLLRIQLNRPIQLPPTAECVTPIGELRLLRLSVEGPWQHSSHTQTEWGPQFLSFVPLHFLL
jgi:hypothetical protein